MAKKYLDEFYVLGNYELHINGDVYNRQTGRKLHPSNELGYDVFRFKISPNAKRKAHKKHRLVATYFIPNPNDLPMVNHIDGNKRIVILIILSGVMHIIIINTLEILD